MSTMQVDQESTETTATTNAPESGCGCSWKSTLKYVLLGIVALIAIFCVVVAVQPEDFRVSRSATMAAPQSAVFEQVNDLHKWEAWSPWAKLDPNAKFSYEGPTTGEGSKFSWDGNSDVGAGSMTIVGSQPDDRVALRLDFTRPMEGTCDVDFTFKPEGDETLVTWSMSGKNGFLAKAISLFIDCEAMAGGQFEQGLANMKQVVEQPATNN